MNKVISILILFSLSLGVNSQSTVTLGLIKYAGGGDWYADPTALPNLAKFCNENLKTNINLQHDVVEVGSKDIFNYPFVHITGHGNILFSSTDAKNLRNYLLSGGFLFIDDNYGFDKFIRREMKKVFPEKKFVELKFDHPIYHQKYHFEQGPPKIHEHDNKAPQGFGIFIEGRLVCYYTYESDISDGWEDAIVHNNSQETRERALQMGANIIKYAFSY